MKIHSISTKNRKKPLFIIALIAVITIGIGTGVYSYYAHQNSHKSDGQTVNMEKSDAERQREMDLQSDPSEKTHNQADIPSQPTVNPSTGKQAVNVVITNAGVYDGNIEARGFVTNSVEQNGTCTYSFTNGTTTKTKLSSVLPNSTSTTCETIRFDVNELSSGSWNVTLEYSSDASYGKSDPREFTVP